MSLDERDENPYEAPHAAIGGDHRFTLPAVEPPVDATKSISVTHDLNDDDLRRFVNCDAFYDPMPLLGFIPQWVWLMPLTAAMGFVFGVARLGSFRTGLLMAPVLCLIVLVVLIVKHKSNRHRANTLGFCEARTLTITPWGLALTISGAKPVVLELADVGPTTQSWSAVRRIDRSEDYITFWLRGRRRLVLPRRAFSSPDEADAFLRTAMWWRAKVG